MSQGSIADCVLHLCCVIIVWGVKCIVTDLGLRGAGVQYQGHEGAVTALCIVPSTAQLVASCDSGGSCHIWSARTGSLVHRLCEPRPGQLAQQPRPASARKQSTCGKTWHLKCLCACLKMSITGPFLKHLCKWLEKSIAEE